MQYGVCYEYYYHADKYLLALRGVAQTEHANKSGNCLDEYKLETVCCEETYY
jgi:hypothetical protein